jgi:hypothetical protein
MYLGIGFAAHGNRKGCSRGFPAHCPRSVEDLNERSKIDIREALIGGSFAPTKKGFSDGANQVYDKSLSLTPNLQLEVMILMADF